MIFKCWGKFKGCMLCHHNMLGPPVDHIWTSQCTCAVEAQKEGIKWTKIGKNGHFSSTYLWR